MSGKSSKLLRKFWASLPENDKKEMLSEMGKKSVKVRLGKLTPEQRSKTMSRVRNFGILKKQLKNQYDISKNGDNTTDSQ